MGIQPLFSSFSRTSVVVIVEFDVITSVNLMSIAFCVVKPCNLERPRRIGGTYRLHLQAGKTKSEQNQAESSAPLAWLTFFPEFGDCMFLRNVGLSLNYTWLHARRPYS
jgi:hypothetical protein